MSNLKELRNRIKSVQSTKKITSAMKMIAAAKLRKAQERVQAARPYAIYMAYMLVDLISRQEKLKSIPRLLVGTGHDQTHLLVIATSNRGLCGSFNSSITRHARTLIHKLQREKKDIKIYCLGQNGFDHLRIDFKSNIIVTKLSFTDPGFHDAEAVALELIERFEAGEFDVCTLVYSRFLSPLKQEVTMHRLIPFTQLEDDFTLFKLEPLDLNHKTDHTSIHVYEPTKEEVLSELLPRNIKTQVFRAMLENAASEHGARMAAMDGATRNATDMINDLTLTYNRTRQAHITNELIEIISGAEAL
jgi:F-type H+-transporting ATPase subunit gamma